MSENLSHRITVVSPFNNEHDKLLCLFWQALSPYPPRLSILDHLRIKPDPLTLACLADKGIVAGASATQLNPNETYLRLFYVHYKYRRQNIGSALLGAVEQEAQRQFGTPVVTLDVEANPEIVVPWFKHKGYEITGKHRTTIQMSKTVG